MTTQLRCATYSRYSSDRQKEASTVDQQRNMMRYAEARGWRVDPNLMFSDEAISGAGLDRPGFQALLCAAKATPRCIDVVLVDDTSRLSRSLADTIRLREDLSFRGIRLIAVSQGIDSEDEQADVMMTVHGLVDSLYIKELAKKTHRGLEGLALKGFHTGGSCFGYQSEKVGDRARLRIDEEEATIVRRIFEMSAAGFSLKRIAKKLNEEGVPPPRGTKKKTRPSWVYTAIREMVRRELYCGRIIWNRRKFKKRPGTNKRTSVLRPESEWVITEEPELRIVSDELWNRVREHLRTRAAKHRGVKPGLLHRAATVPYLFSGLLKCDECGANLIILTGRGKDGKKPSYGCPHHFNRGTCSNGLYQRRDQLEECLLAGLHLEAVSGLPAPLSADPVSAKTELLKHVAEIRMVPSEADGKRFYIAEGEWNILPRMRMGARVANSAKNPHQVSFRIPIDPSSVRSISAGQRIVMATRPKSLLHEPATLTHSPYV